MRRDLDEIEMEMGKESMKVGDRVRTYYTRKEGVITGPCPRHKGNWLVDVGDETCDVKCAAECNLIPVEPERVWYCAEPGILCGLPPCPENCGRYCPGLREGVKVASPGLLQRMGMATWDDAGWFVVLYEPTRKGAKMLVTTDLGLKTEQEARSWVREGPNRRAFRWQDGLR